MSTATPTVCSASTTSRTFRSRADSSTCPPDRWRSFAWSRSKKVMSARSGNMVRAESSWRRRSNDDPDHTPRNDFWTGVLLTRERCVSFTFMSEDTSAPSAHPIPQATLEAFEAGRATLADVFGIDDKKVAELRAQGVALLNAGDFER